MDRRNFLKGILATTALSTTVGKVASALAETKSCLHIADSRPGSYTFSYYTKLESGSWHRIVRTYEYFGGDLEIPLYAEATRTQLEYAPHNLIPNSGL